LGGHEAGEVVHVDALHDDDDRTRAFVVKPGQEGVGEPLVGALPLGRGEGVERLQGIVDNDEVAAPSGENAPDRRGEAEAVPGGCDLALAVLASQAHARKGLPVPGRLHDGTEVVHELDRELLAVADADDALRRVVTEHERGQRHRGGDRLQGARGHVDDQPPDAPEPHLLEVPDEGADVPSLEEGYAGRERHGASADEACQVLAQDGIAKRARGDLVHHAPSSPREAF
jgi:hypothetical protein